MAIAAILGVGMTAFRKRHGIPVAGLAKEAATEALRDADIKAQDVDLVFAANAVGGILHGQAMVSGQFALRDSALFRAPIVNVENACASSSSALHLACLAVSSGQIGAALVLGFEKLTHPVKQRSLAAIGTAADLSLDEDAYDRVQEVLLGQGVNRHRDSVSHQQAHTPFMETYALEARAYMSATGASDRDIALVAVKNHNNGLLNSFAQYGARYSVEEVLASRSIVAPLTLLMCSPISDGAAAIVVAAPDCAPSRRSIGIESSVMVSGRDREAGEDTVVQRASMQAYEEASIAPVDLDLVELHDAAAPAELALYEEIGLCSRGDGPSLIRSGYTELGGTIPVNTSGGLIARGHPIGASGAAQIVELVVQLRGEAHGRQVQGAQLALAQNSGGHLGIEPAVSVVTILSAPPFPRLSCL